MTVLLLPFQFGFLLFFSSLTAVAKTSKTILNSSGESRHPCLFLILEGMLSAFHQLSMMLSVAFINIVIYGFYYIEVGSLYAHFMKGVFSEMGVGFCQRRSLHRLRGSYGFCSSVC